MRREEMSGQASFTIGKPSKRMTEAGLHKAINIHSTSHSDIVTPTDNRALIAENFGLNKLI